MSRTRRIFVIASLIVFGLLAPAPADAVLTHCSEPWQGFGDTFESSCTFRLGGGSADVLGVALAPTAAHASVHVKLLRYGLGPNPVVLAECSGSGTAIAQCSAHFRIGVPPVDYDVVCVVHGVALEGVYSCRTV